MKKHSLVLVLSITALLLPLWAVDVWFSAAPGSAGNGAGYYIEATSVTYSPEGSDLWLYKNGSYAAGSSGYGGGYLSAGTTQADGGPQTIEYYAEAWDWYYYESASAWHYITIDPPANTPPFGVCDYAHAAVPAGGNMYAAGWAVDNEVGAPVVRVDILIDGNDVADADNGGDRWDVADAFGRPDYRYSGWGINYNVGSLGVGTHTLEFRAWDNEGASGTFGYRTFEVTNSSPDITLLAPAAQVVALGATLTITSHATDPDGDITWHNLDIQRPNGTWNFQGGFASGEPYSGGPVGSGGDSTRSATFTFDEIGTWYVRSWVSDSAGQNLHSATVAITVVDNVPPSIPSGLFATSITTNSFTLNWQASTDNVGMAYHHVYRNGTYIGSTNGTQTSLPISSLTSGTTYNMTVQAQDLAGNQSAQSVVLPVTTTVVPSPPTVPTGLTVSNLAATSFTLNWNASTDNIGVTQYEVYKNGVLYGATASTSLNITNLSTGTAHTMTVRARDAEGSWSALSAGLSVAMAASDTNGNGVADWLEGSLTSYDASFSTNATADTLSGTPAGAGAGATKLTVLQPGK